MTTQKFSINEALEFGWSTMKSNFWFFVGLLIVWGLLLWIPYAIAIMAMEVNVFLGFILMIADYALTIVISMGLVKIALSFCDKEKGRISDLFSQYRLFFNYLFAFILYYLIAWGPLLLLVILGGIIFWVLEGIIGINIGLIDNILSIIGLLLVIPIIIILVIKFWFFDYFVVDKKATPIKALKGSSMITKGVKWNLFVFFLAIIGINMLGAIALLVGLFVTIPTTIVAMAFVYRKLLAQVEGENIQTSEISEAPETSPEQVDR